jgi:hypothetical protein
VKKCASAVASSGALFVVGCDYGSDAGTETNVTTATTTVQATWSGPPRPLKNGILPVDGFAEYLETLPADKRDPRSQALEFLRPRRPYALTVSTRRGLSTVTVLRDDLDDDSVRTERYHLVFAHGVGGRAFLRWVRVEYRCQPNRGHQDFSSELCL